MKPEKIDMKKKIYILIGFILFSYIATILQSCCEDEIRLRSSIDVMAFTKNDDNSYTVNDTIKGPFSLSFYVHTYGYQGFEFMSSAYATSCGYVYLNQIDKNSIKLFLDESIVFNNDTLPKNQNVLALANSGIEMTSGEDFIRFNFDKEFITKTQFLTDSVTFRLDAKTNDDTLLVKDIRMFVK